MKTIIALLTALSALSAGATEVELSSVAPDIQPKAVGLKLDKGGKAKRPVGKLSTGKEPVQYQQLNQEYAKAPKLVDPNRPAGSTARCMDGTYGFPGKNGACYKHGGVSAWLQ